MITILVSDDEKMIRWSLEQALKQEGYSVVTSSDCAETLQAFEREMPELVLLDMKFPDGSGIDLMKKMKEINRDVIIIILTAVVDINSAVEAMKLGAYDYINKPFNVEELKVVIKRGVEAETYKYRFSRQYGRMKERYSFSNIVGESGVMKECKQLAGKLADTDVSNILISGESGTGKEVFAKAIHFASNRAEKPFIELNCSAIPEQLMESELFGHERGAFTDAVNMKKGLFELADEGTIFLDEIADMQIGLQGKLLRVMESKTFKRVGGTKDIVVDVTIVSATNKELEEEVRNNRFRKDLFYRLNVFSINLPPLRNRGQDIMILAKRFIEEFNIRSGCEIDGIAEEAEELLLNHRWDGNVRELRNMIERVVILKRKGMVRSNDLNFSMVFGESKLIDDLWFSLKEKSLEEITVEIERKLINKALETCEGNQTKASEALRISREQLRYRMEKYK